MLAGCGELPSGPTAQPQAVGPQSASDAKVPTRLHWFLPDGMRADPEVFDVFRWAEEGRLPHIKKLMERGTYGYSIPTFPSHTPTNFATLMTGAPPAVHGVADGPMRTEGSPLARPSVGGFSSSARRVPAAWSLMEDSGRKVVVMSMPGSTPPELDNGVTVRGRWGGWGADFPALLFEHDDVERKKDLGRLSRLFMLSTELTRFVEVEPASSSAGAFPPPASWQAVAKRFPSEKATAMVAMVFQRVTAFMDTPWQVGSGWYPMGDCARATRLRRTGPPTAQDDASTEG